MAITVKVSCPVCRTSLSYDHKEAEAWGSVGLKDFATVELTAHDGGAVRDHMMTHYNDGTWAAAVRKQAEHDAAFINRLDELGK
jgi:hypothetical protein